MDRCPGQRPHSGIVRSSVVARNTVYRTVAFATVSGEIDDAIYEAIPLFRAERCRVKNPGNPTGLVSAPAGVLDDHHFPGKTGSLRIMRRTTLETLGSPGHHAVLRFLAILLAGTLSKIRAIVVYSSGTIEVNTVVRRHSITGTNKITRYKVGVPGKQRLSPQKMFAIIIMASQFPVSYSAQAAMFSNPTPSAPPGTYYVQSDAGGGPVNAVTQIVAGNNITISPPTGTGVVTINGEGGGGGGTVGGPAGAVQFNEASAFGGSANAILDASGHLLCKILDTSAKWVLTSTASNVVFGLPLYAPGLYAVTVTYDRFNGDQGWVGSNSGFSGLISVLSYYPGPPSAGPLKLIWNVVAATNNGGTFTGVAQGTPYTPDPTTTQILVGFTPGSSGGQTYFSVSFARLGGATTYWGGLTA